MKVLITGSSSGIGLKLAQDYLAQGHTVYCCGRNQDALTSLVAQYPTKAISLCFDTTDRTDCAGALSKLSELDIVILNAGTCEYINTSDFSAAAFEHVVNVNLVGTANCLQFLLPKLNSGSRLALMGSSSSYVPLPRAEAYGASKAAIEYLAKTLAVSLRHKKISVSLIAPGFVETPLTDLNDFPMPMLVNAEFASRRIQQGLSKRSPEIHFPKPFTLTLKLIGMLPNRLQQAIISKALSGQKTQPTH